MNCKGSLKNTKYWKETSALKVYYVTFTVFQDVACINCININVQEKLYEFEQNKKNNLIFHGVLAEHPETSDRSSFKGRVYNFEIRF